MMKKDADLMINQFILSIVYHFPRLVQRVESHLKKVRS